MSDLLTIDPEGQHWHKNDSKDAPERLRKVEVEWIRWKFGERAYAALQDKKKVRIVYDAG